MYVNVMKVERQQQGLNVLQMVQTYAEHVMQDIIYIKVQKHVLNVHIHILVQVEQKHNNRVQKVKQVEILMV